MKTIELPGTGIRLSQIGLGTANLGVEMTDDDVARLINVYRDAGGTHLDTAHVYAFWTRFGAGSSECAIARYIKANGRGDLVIATKGGHPGLPGYRRVDRWLDPYRIRADIEDSLGRLETDVIDLYYLHRDDTRLPVGEIIETLNEHVRAGTIRSIGASNWTWERIRDANAYASEHGLQGFVASQIQWNLAVAPPPDPQPHGTQGVYAQPADMEFHRTTDIPLVAYSAAGGGMFERAEGEALPLRYDSPQTHRRSERATEIAASRGATVTQVALAWMLGQPFPCVALTGTSNPDHLSANLAAATLQLSADEIAQIAPPL
jgi:aryl-alcohol dehydrogenase-like predicted oxidoreductase